jgi:hypothetical protein
MEIDNVLLFNLNNNKNRTRINAEIADLKTDFNFDKSK